MALHLYLQCLGSPVKNYQIMLFVVKNMHFSLGITPFITPHFIRRFISLQ